MSGLLILKCLKSVSELESSSKEERNGGQIIIRLDD